MCYAAPTRRLLFTARHQLSFVIPYLVFGVMSMESYEMKMRNPSRGTPPYSFWKRGMGSFMYNVNRQGIIIINGLEHGVSELDSKGLGIQT